MSRVTRRQTLKLIAAAGTAAGAAAAAGATPGCTRDAKGRTPMKPVSNDGSDSIVSVTPLGFPWRTHDPFLFCVVERPG